MTTKNEVSQNDDGRKHAPISLLLLSWAFVVMVGLKVFPMVLNKPNSHRADHMLAMLVFWSMSAAMVRGAGYIPKHRIPRYLFGTWAVIVCIALAVIWKVFGFGA